MRALCSDAEDGMTVRRALLLAVVTGLSIGCNGPGGADKEDTGAGDEDTGGGGTGDLWRPAGSGVAYFLDGTVDNSLFHLELTRCTDPAEGEAYYGWVSKSGADPIAVGEITVSNEEVYFESDIGENALLAGYDTFEAWATDNGGTAPEGRQLWVGQVDPIVYDVIQNLVFASALTPDGQGSLRSLETALQEVRTLAQDTLDAPFSASSFTDASESIANSLEGVAEDRNDDGSATTIEGQLGVLGDGGYVELILADLTAATGQVEPGNPIKDYVNYAYDCTQEVESHARYAAINADVASVCLAEDSCRGRMEDAVTEIDSALNGFDTNEDGTIDLLTEGTLECAISWVAAMAQMSVATP